MATTILIRWVGVVVTMVALRVDGVGQDHLKLGSVVVDMVAFRFAGDGHCPLNLGLVGVDMVVFGVVVVWLV